jgi:hypothetical protein
MRWLKEFIAEELQMWVLILVCLVGLAYIILTNR